MSNAARNYKAGTQEALALLSQGYCYFPECDEPVIKFVEDTPINALQIAHIYAALEGGPHYKSGMIDAERAHFDNLILLCEPHHTLVDKRRPEDYPPEVRQRWKSDRESSLLGEHRDLLKAVTAEAFEEALENAIVQVAPMALVTVDFKAIVETPAGHIAYPFEGIEEMLAMNDGLGEVHSLAEARNTGQLPVDVVSWDLMFGPKNGGLIGANGFPHLQQCPQRLEVGSVVRWMWHREQMPALQIAIDMGAPIETVRAVVNLATGVAAESDPVRFELIPTDEDLLAQLRASR